MYKVSVPVIVGNLRFERYYKRYIELFKEAKVDRVFLCAAMWTSPECEKQRCQALLSRFAPIFKNEGFEVGVWINSLGHGGTCADFVNNDASDGLTRMVSLDGHINYGAYCPLCENVRALANDWIGRLGATGVDMIMLDDDYRYGYRGEILCACDKHKAVFEKELGEKFDSKRMKDALTSGGPNKWRDAWLKVQGESLIDFAKMLRNTLNKKNPSVRMSICSVPSTWDVDGADSLSLSRAFAGNTKPFLRLIGAPYWAALRQFQEIRLGAVCEYERLQMSWAKESSIEIFAEGDTYPRPAYSVPAAYLEGFDQVMRADGSGNGILKYMMDYTSSPDFEMRYIQTHIRNKPLYDAVEHAFSNKKAVGVTVYSPMKTFGLSHNPGVNPDARCIDPVLRFVSDNNLPVQFEAGEHAVFIFGDAAELADKEQLKNGAVLDMEAAKILTRRGIDVGLKAIKGEFSPNAEHFFAEDEDVGVVGGRWFEAEISEKAAADSELEYREEGKETQKCPASYIYENADHEKFLVYCFEARVSFERGAQRCIFRNPLRAAQLRRLLPVLSGRKMDAIADSAPDMYMLVKKNASELTAAIWNFSVDTIDLSRVYLADTWNDIECHIGNAKLSENTVLTDPIPAFGCVCFTVKN